MRPVGIASVVLELALGTLLWYWGITAGIILLVGGLAGLVLLILAVANPGKQESLGQPPASSLPVAPSSRARAFICDICGKEMPLREISTHQQMYHSEALHERQRANRDFIRILMTIYGLASAVLLVAILTPVYIFGLRAPPGWDVIAAFTGWAASILAGMLYAYNKTRAFEMFRNLLFQCWYCDVPIPRKDLRVHLRTEHPREARYLRISMLVALGSLLGIVGVAYIYALVALPDLLPNVLVAALFSWIGFIVFWNILVDRHHTAKARAAWRTTHLNTP